MVYDQIVEYASAQQKLGVSRDAIRTVLLGAGWQATDIDDSFKKMDGGAKPVSSPQPAASPSTAASPVASSIARPAEKPGEPHVIRMSDLVSGSDGPVAMSAVASASKTIKPAMSAAILSSKKEAMPGIKMPAGATEFHAASDTPSKMKGMTPWIICGVLVVVLGGLAGYLYIQNNSLAGQVASLGGQSSSVTSQVTALTAQVNALTASGTAMNTQIAGLVGANQELLAELSFYAVPPGTTATSTSLSVTGAVNINAAKNYFVIGSYGGRIFVANSKDAKVIAALQPLVGSSTQLTGTFMPGSDTMTVTAVNGTSL